MDVRFLDADHTVVQETGADYSRTWSRDAFDRAHPGVQVDPYVAPPAPPVSVTPWQAREALRLAGKLAAVEAAVEALGVTHPAYIAWHYAERIRRDSPLIAALQGGLGLTDEDLDDLFEVAKGLSL